MKKCAFIPVDDKHFYPEGTHIAINSFKRFHPDIDLFVIRQNTVDKLFKEKKINWYQAKPFLAELFEDEYDLIANFDADHIFLDRLTEVFDNVDYDIAGPWNFNDYENASFDNITETMYVQAGFIASTSKIFWKIWREANKDAMLYLRRENDILNLVWWNNEIINKMKRKIVDKEKDYYGCKSLGREPEFTINEKGETICRGEKIFAYHFARGGVFPKLSFDDMPLIDEVKIKWKEIGYYGQSVLIKGI